jgi:carboxyl-terminal processing protease
MEPKNTKFSIYLPLMLAGAIILGIIADRVIIGNSFQNTFGNNDSRTYNKVDALLKIIQDNYVDTVNMDSISDNIIPLLLEELDPHSVYIPKSEMQGIAESLHGNFEGIGVQFNIQNDTVLIVNTISGGPSAKVGILPGDRIVTINDSVFAGTGIKNEDVFKKLKGPKGTKVKVGILRRGTKGIINFDITRDQIPFYSIDASFMVDSEIGYVKINRFAGTTYEEFLEASIKLKQSGMKKMILDLRQNGGGYLDAAVKIIDEFLPKGKLIVYTQGQARKKTEYTSTDSGICEDIELIVLIDSWSASASEIVAGAIQDNDRGTIIGTRSFGKGLVQEEFNFPDSSGFRLTIARYYTPSGRCIQKPYDDGTKSYYSDIHDRAKNGELQNKDSVHINKSKKYYTSKGREVFGGGGIMPDIFVANDTSEYSDFYYQITYKGIIYDFALIYTDKNRQKLSTFKTPEKLSEYLESQHITEKFIEYSVNKKVIPKGNDLKISKALINNKLKAYIARNIIDENAFYKISKDNVLNEAVKHLKK